VLCLGTATEEDRNTHGVLVPKNFYSEGYLADEPYSAWTDDEGWHHMIWGTDHVGEKKRHVRTEEKGCATPSGAAIIVLQELSRRKMEAYEDFMADRAKQALDMLLSSQPPSWYRPYHPTFINRHSQRLWAPLTVDAKPEFKPLDESEDKEVAKRRQDFRNAFSLSLSLVNAREGEKLEWIIGDVLEECTNCGCSRTDTTQMRLGPDKRRSLCNACGLFYVTMGHLGNASSVDHELNKTREFVDLSIGEEAEVVSEEEKKVEAPPTNERVVVSLETEEEVHVRLKLDVAPEEPFQPSEENAARNDEHKLIVRYPNVHHAASAPNGCAVESSSHVTRGTVEDYPIDMIDWDALPHYTKLVTLASTGLLTNRQIMADEYPDERLVQRAVPYAAHSHLKRMVETGKYAKYMPNVTDSERYKPVQVTFKPDQIDGLTIFGYAEEKVQESLEGHIERRVETAAIEEEETKRETLASIAMEDLDAKRMFEYHVEKGISTFEKAEEKAVRDAERERENARRRKEAEEQEAIRQAELELHGNVKKGGVDLEDVVGYTDEELRAYEGEVEIPQPIEMTCNGHLGVLQTMGRARGERVHDIGSDTIVGAGEFERMSGSGSSKKWKCSCRVRNSDGSVGTNMLTHLIERGDEFGDEIIGRRVAIWWPTEELYYLGYVEGYNSANGEHAIKYDDNQVEDIMLFMQKFKWLDEDVLLPGKEEQDDEGTQTKVHVRPPGVAGAEEATVRVPLGGFSVYARIKPAVTFKNSERRKCYEILQAVRKVVDEDGRNISEPFEKLPSRFALPEYYDIIKCPVDCASIERMLRKPSGGYPNVWFFLVGMELMFTNCKRFNDPAALLYSDADVLRNVYLEAVKERFPGQPVPPSITVYDSVDEPAWDKPTDDGIIEDEDDPFPQKYVAPTLETLKKRRISPEWEEEEVIRQRKSQRTAPRDRRVPKDPMKCVVYILSRVRGNAMPLDALHELMIEKGVKDFETSRRPLAALGALLRQNPALIREARGGELWELVDKVDVDSDDEIFINGKENEDDASEDKASPPPPVKLSMTKKEIAACKIVLQAIRSCKDKKGRELAEPFELLPTRKQLPDYYRAISAPIDLGSIQRCLNAGGYPSTWMFCVAVELMLSNCQNYNEPSSQLYKDADTLRGVVAKAMQSEYPGHPLPKRDSVYDAEQCVEPRWKKTPTLKFTMRKNPTQ
jgi:protein polybromo-1